MAYLATSADLIGRTYQWLREPSASPQYWPSSTVVDHLDEAHAKVVADFWLSRSEWFSTTSASVGNYTLPSDIEVVRHVLYLKDNGTNTKYAALTRKGANDFIVGDYLASGTATNWALVGVGSGPIIKLWPMPDTSAASGIYTIGSRTPPTLATSATQVPSQIIEMVPLQAALRLWQERGNLDEVARLTATYDTRLSGWRQKMVDMGLDEQDSWEFATFESQYPHAGTLRPVMLTPNPLWP